MLNKVLFSMLQIIIMCSYLNAQIEVNGDFSEDEYLTLATRLNLNRGFAPAGSELTNVYYAIYNENLYLGFECLVQNESNQYNPLPDGLGAFLNFSSQQGRNPGEPLGINEPFDYHFLNGAIEWNLPFTLEFKADFEVDYLFAIYSNATPDSFIFDASTQVANHPKNIQNIGKTTQSAIVSAGPETDGVFSARSIKFSFQPSKYIGSKKGFEISIPFSEVGANPDDSFELFAFLVSSTSYFSDQTIPGDVTSGNSGGPTDYLSNVIDMNCFCPNPGGTIGSGLYHTSCTSLGVELKK